MRRFYIYRHIRTDLGIPFYIGVGTISEKTGFHSEHKRAFAKTNRNELWKSIAKNGFEVEIIFESEDASEIKNKEREFIELYGRLCAGDGILANISNGGGACGCRKTPEQRKRISEKLKGRTMSDEQKAKLSAIAKAQGRKPPINDAIRAKLSDANKKRNHYWGDKISKAKMGHTVSEEARKKMSEGNKGKKLSEETRYKMSIARKGKKLNLTEECRERKREHMRTIQHLSPASKKRK